MNVKVFKFCLVLFLTTFAFPAIVQADEISRHEISDSYQVYLGVVAASLIKEKPFLIDSDVSLHSSLKKQGRDAYHVMVAIYDKSSNKRIRNATVIAEVEEKSLVGGTEEEKPLEKMVTSGTITYGNYFTLKKGKRYSINMKIYQGDRGGYEEVTFLY